MIVVIVIAIIKIFKNFRYEIFCIKVDYTRKNILNFKILKFTNSVLPILFENEFFFSLLLLSWI